MESNNLKDEILTVISGLMGDDQDIRQVAEDRRKALEFKHTYGVTLAEIMVLKAEPAEERVMCGVLLKPYITSYWVSKPDFCSASAKEKVRNFLCECLSDGNVKIQNSAGNLLAVIANFDYPKTWPDMMDILCEKLSSVDETTVVGGVIFLEECFRLIPNIFHTNMPQENLYQSFYDIIEKEQFSTNLRSKVVTLVTNYIIEDFFNDSTDHVKNIANRFCGLMGYILNQTYGMSSDFQLKSNIVKSFTKFLYSLPDVVGTLILSTLPIVWEILTKCSTEYRQIIAKTRTMPVDSGEDEHYPMHFMNLVDSIFTLIQYISLTESTSDQITPILTEIFHSIIIFMSVTPYIERAIYEDDENDFGDEMDENVVSNTTRTGLRFLLQALVNSYDFGISLSNLQVAISQHLNNMEIVPTYDIFTSRINESIMYGLGSVSALTTNPAAHLRYIHNDTFNIKNYLTTWTMTVQQTDLLLVCRIMLTSSRFCWIFTPEEYYKQLSMVYINLASEHVICRNAAVRALNFHCSYLKENTQHHNAETLKMLKDAKTVFISLSEEMLQRLITLCPHVNIGILTLIVSNICDITVINPINATIANWLVPFMVDIFVKNINRTKVIESTKKLMHELSSNEVSAFFFQTSLMPSIITLIAATPGQSLAEVTEAKSVALDMFSVLLRTVNRPEMRQTLYDKGFNLVYKCIVSTDDDQILNGGIRCMCVYLLRFAECMNDTICMDVFRAILNHLLDPSKPSECCRDMDTLLLCLINVYYTQLTPCVDPIIKGMLSRLNFCQSLNIRDTLILVFMALFYYYPETVMSLLSSLPGPDGTASALQFIAPLMLDVRYNSVYLQNLYVLVLSKIMETTLVNDDVRIKALFVDHHYELPSGGANTAPTDTNGNNADVSTTPSTSSDKQPQPSPVSGAVGGNGGRLKEDKGKAPLKGKSVLPASVTSTGNIASSGSACSLMSTGTTGSSTTMTINMSDGDIDEEMLLTASKVTQMQHVPYMKKAFRMLLDVALFNQVTTAPPADGRVVDSGGVPSEMDGGSSSSTSLASSSGVGGSSNKNILFPDAGQTLDLCKYMPMTEIARVRVVEHIEQFVQSLATFNYLEQFVGGLNVEHTDLVKKILDSKRGVDSITSPRS